MSVSRGAREEAIGGILAAAFGPEMNDNEETASEEAARENEKAEGRAAAATACSSLLLPSPPSRPPSLHAPRHRLSPRARATHPVSPCLSLSLSLSRSLVRVVVESSRSDIVRVVYASQSHWWYSSFAVVVVFVVLVVYKH